MLENIFYFFEDFFGGFRKELKNKLGRFCNINLFLTYVYIF